MFCSAEGRVSPGSIATISYLSESTHAGPLDINAGGSLYACAMHCFNVWLKAVQRRASMKRNHRGAGSNVLGLIVATSNSEGVGSMFCDWASPAIASTTPLSLSRMAEPPSSIPPYNCKKEV